MLLAALAPVVTGCGMFKPDDPQRFLDPEQRRLLETCASLIALAIERDQSLLEAHEAQLQAQTEHLRSSLLSSVSHDLRTPLAAIAGAASSLLESPPGQDGSDRQELLQSIVEESQRLARLVDEGIFTKVAYQERPVRHEYRLTEKGLGLYPVIVTLLEWGNEFLDWPDGEPPVHLVDRTTGERIEPVLVDARRSSTAWIQQPHAWFNELLKILVTRYNDDVQVCLETARDESSDYIIGFITAK